MNPEDRMQPSSRKIRVRTHGGRSQKPYARPKRRKSDADGHSSTSGDSSEKQVLTIIRPLSL